MDSFKVTNVNDLELLYSILREKFPNKEIQIVYNWNIKEYKITVTNKLYTQDPEVPVDLNIEVVYGDSVTGDTPLLLKKDGLVYIETIGSIFNEKRNFEYPGFKMFDETIRLEKEYSESDYQVWSDIGWVDIKKVIRHKTDKKIYNILTHNGFVKVTEDHSLLTENSNIIKPSECNLETKLLSNYPDKFECNIKKVITEKEAEVFGFFMKYGELVDTYECNVPKWNLYNQDINRLEYFQEILESIENIKFEIIKTNDNYKLIPTTNVEYMVDKYQKLFYTNDSKKVPTEILNSNIIIITNFLNGYEFNVTNETQIGCAGLYFLMKKLGHNVTINTREDKDNIFKLTLTNSNQRKVCNQIKKIKVSDVYDDYVYDIETECGRFQAGVGNIIVKNTDSIFIKFKYNRDDFERNRSDTFKLATVCGDNLTHKVFKRPPIDLEFEKVFNPFILLSKKRYIANKYENTKDPFDLKGVDAKGIALTRRDYCPMVKKCYKEVIDTILNNKSGTSLDSVKKSIELYKGYIDKIYNYMINIDDLIVSAMLASSYKTKPVHVQLAEKLKERKEEVQIGDRIPYIFVENTSNTSKQKSELGEDPKYAIQNNLKYNRQCYIEQLAKPLLGFYKIALKDNEDLLDKIIDYTNDTLVNCGGKRLKVSDFKIDD